MLENNETAESAPETVLTDQDQSNGDEQENVSQDQNNGSETKKNGLLDGVNKAAFSTVDMDEEAANLAGDQKQAYSNTEAGSGEEFTTGSGSGGGDPHVDGEQQSSKAKNKKVAERLAKMFDRIFAFFAAMYAGDEDSEYYRAKQKEIEEMASEAAEFFEESGMEIKLPPWLGLAVIMVFVYGDKMKLAKKRKKQNEAKAAAKEKEEKLRKAGMVPNPAHGASKEDIRVPKPDISDATIISETLHADLKDCEYCGTKTGNKKFCSRECGAKYNAKNGNVGAKKKY